MLGVRRPRHCLGAGFSCLFVSFFECAGINQSNRFVALADALKSSSRVSVLSVLLGLNSQNVGKTLDRKT